MPRFLKKNKNFIIFFTLVFLQLVLISFQVPRGKSRNVFESIVYSLFAPVQHSVVAAAQFSGKTWNDYFDLRNVREKNLELEEELFSLYQENVFLKSKLQRFQSNEEILSLLQKIHHNILPARVISLDFSDYLRSVNINKGSLDGLKKDMAVLDKYGNLIGHVVEPVAYHEATVHLVTDSDFSVSVFSQNNKIPGIVSGDGKGSCFLKYILSTEEGLSEGERVVTSGFDGIFSPGIHVGEILSIKTSDALFKEIKVKPLFSLKDLDQVAVIKIDPKEFF